MLAYESPIEVTTPRAYAERLASYLNDPQAIYLACRREYGREGIPSQSTIAGMIEVRKAKRLRVPEVAENDDGAHWAYRAPDPRKSGRKAVPVEVVARVAPVVEQAEGKPFLLSMFPRQLVRKIAHDFGIPYEEMVGDRRFRHLITARTVAAQILHERGLSYQQIGRHLGGRDHATVGNLLARFPYYAGRSLCATGIYQSHSTKFSQGVNQ